MEWCLSRDDCKAFTYDPLDRMNGQPGNSGENCWIKPQIDSLNSKTGIGCMAQTDPKILKSSN